MNKNIEKGLPEVKRVDDNRVDEVIAEMFKIESSALAILRDTEREKEEYAADLEHKIREFDDNLAVETDKKIKALGAQFDTNKENELKSMREDIGKYINKLDETYEEKHEKWVNDIVDAIIKE